MHATDRLSHERTPDASARMAARHRLVQDYTPLVRRLVRNLTYRVPMSVDRNTLFSAGIVGLLDAADRFDDDRSVAFEAYARIRVRGAILDELRGLDHLTRTQRRRSRAVAEVRGDLERQGGAPDAEVASALGLTVEQVQTSRQHHVPPEVVDPQVLANQSARRLWSEAGSAEDHVVARERIHEVSRALAGLPERNRLVVGLYYEAEITLQEIGDLLGVTQSRVSQILKKTMDLLHEQLAPIA